MVKRRLMRLFYSNTPRFVQDGLRNLSYHKYKEHADFIKEIHKEKVWIRIIESYQIYMAVKDTNHLDGELVEVGVSWGESARVICEAKQNKSLYLFDTFDGLPEVSKIDCYYDFVGSETYIPFKKGMCKSSLKKTKKYLNKFNNLHFYKGYFPETAGPIMDKNFAFVHLDVDLYKGTLEALKFFFPRMVRGGRIIIHDYLALGIQKAVNEFFTDKSEPVITISHNQCLIIKS